MSYSPALAKAMAGLFLAGCPDIDAIQIAYVIYLIASCG